MSTYHHGDLRRAVLDAAVEALAETGPETLSLRDLARRAGVSHAAPAHHFGDRAGLLTALALRAQLGLLEQLRRVDTAAPSGLADLGAAYVAWAVDHPALARVIDADHLLRTDDAELVAARAETRTVLTAGLAPDGEAADHGERVVGAWSMARGYATLWTLGRLDPSSGGDGAGDRAGDGTAAAAAFHRVARAFRSAGRA